MYEQIKIGLMHSWQANLQSLLQRNLEHISFSEVCKSLVFIVCTSLLREESLEEEYAVSLYPIILLVTTDTTGH